MSDISKKVSASYDCLASAYAARNDAETPSKLVPLLSELADSVGQTGKILDVGCGTGREMAWLEARGLKICGIDASPAMLAYARSKVTGDLVLMDMTCLAFRPATFDGLWCCASLLHVPKIAVKKALAEMHRVLRSRGVLALVLQEGTGEGWEESYVANAPRFFARYSADEFSVLVSNSGFDVANITTVSGADRNWLACLCRRSD